MGGSQRRVESLSDAIVVLWGWRRNAVAFLAGAVSAFAFAPFYAVPVLWLTIPVFIWLIDGAEAGEETAWLRRLWPAAIIGYCYGFGFFLSGLWWVGTAFLAGAAADVAWVMPIAVILLPAILAPFWAFGAALARLFWIDGWPRIVVFAIAMTLAEWLRGHLFTGFPWNVFGYAITPVPLLMQPAALIGIWGLTLAAFFVFAVPALFADVGGRRAAWSATAAAMLLAVADLGYGAWVLRTDVATVPNVRIRIMQPSIPQDAYWQTPESGEETLSRYVQLSQSEGGLAGITHLVWPESAFPFFLTERPEALTAIADLLPEGTTLFTGAARIDRASEERDVFNSVYAIDDEGVIVAAYDKVHLVPFGEYLPARGLLEAMGLRSIASLPGGFTPGQRLRTLVTPGAPPVGPLICYEAIFSGAVTDPDDRPAWLLNLTNDGWYGGTPGPYQHLLQARVRAVEEGLPLVRAANTGISAIIDPRGRITASLGLRLAGVVDGDLPQALPPTPYGRWGTLVFVGLLVFAGVAAAVGASVRRR